MIFDRIDRAVSDFAAAEGRRPNVLIVGPQAECDLYALGVRPGATVRAMKVIADDSEPDFSVAYQKPR